MLETSAEIVDALRIRLGVDTDSAVAAALGIRHSAISHWRYGRSAMSPELAMKAAELLGVEPGPLVLACLAETDRRPSVAALFRELAERLGRGAKRGRKAAAVVALAIGAAALGGVPTPSQAAQADARGLYIMANRRRSDWQPAPA